MASASSKPADLRGRPDSRSYVEVSTRVFALVWLASLALHALCVVYFTATARFYWVTHGSFLASLFKFYTLGLDPQFYPILTAIHGALAVYHALQIGYMVVWSAFKRQWSISFFPQIKVREILERLLSSRHQQGLKETSRVTVFLTKTIGAAFGRQGLFGVEGKYFETVLVVRELVETSLQSTQAYYMSVHVPRPWLNRLYVALIVINCLMTPLLHEVFATKRLMRRAVLLACDAMLDLFSSVIMPSLLIITYLDDYEPSTEGFAASLWLDEFWFVNATNELQLLLVTSWSDLACCVLFSTAFIGCLENVKSLVRIRPVINGNAVYPSRGSMISVAPHASSSSTDKVRGATSSLIDLRPVSCWSRRCARIVNVAFGVWGIVVLALHFHAESVPRLPQCAVQVRPWFVRNSACAMLQLDCHASHTVGTRDHVASEWSTLEAPYVVRVVIRHCARLQMPREVRRFGFMAALKIYNSTVDEWSSDTALTDTDHPLLTTLMLIRVDVPHGQLPAGLVSPAFPRHLLSIQICGSNLHTLPDALDAAWPLHGFYLFEHARFTSVPSVLRRLQPQQLSFANNQLTSFPYDAYTWPNLSILNVGGNPISSLLDATIESPNSSSSVFLIVLTDTNITFLPHWIDRVLLDETPGRRWGVLASRTPLCRDAERIERGELTAFPGAEGVPAASLSFAMAIPTPRTTVLMSRGVCTPFKTLFYPLAIEDAVNRLP